jgi:hypothetical protein
VIQNDHKWRFWKDHQSYFLGSSKLPPPSMIAHSTAVNLDAGFLDISELSLACKLSVYVNGFCGLAGFLIRSSNRISYL